MAACRLDRSHRGRCETEIRFRPRPGLSCWSGRTGFESSTARKKRNDLRETPPTFLTARRYEFLVLSLIAKSAASRKMGAKEPLKRSATNDCEASPTTLGCGMTLHKH